LHHFLIALFLGTILAAASWAQDTNPDEADETENTQVEANEVEDAADEDAEGIDDSDLDEQTYSDADDDFRPSEDIPADQSIAFPTDI